jgi:hypothetical protein
MRNELRKEIKRLSKKAFDKEKAQSERAKNSVKNLRNEQALTQFCQL